MSRTLNIYDATANYDQRIAPIKKPRKQRERQPCRGIETSGSDAAPLEQGKLAAEKKVLRFDRSPRSDGQRNQVDKVGQQSNDDLNDIDHASDQAQRIEDASSLPGSADQIFAEHRSRAMQVGRRFAQLMLCCALTVVFGVGVAHSAAYKLTLVDPIARLEYGKAAGHATLLLRAEGLSASDVQKKDLLAAVVDLQRPDTPSIKREVAVAELTAPGPSSRTWLLTVAADGVPANTTQPRWLNVALSGEEQVLPYTLTNAAAAPFSWTVRGLPSVGVSPGEPIPIGISVGPVPATGVRTALTGLIEKESMQLIAPKGLVLCPSGTTPCTSAFVDIPPNSPAELWLWGVDRVGKFEGSLIIASAEKPAGDSVAMTVYSTSLCYQIAGVVVIFLSVALSWLCTVFVRSRLDRAQLLLPAVMLRKSLDGLKTKIATMPAELKATNVSTTIGNVEQKLSDDQLEQVGLPGSTVAPWNASTSATSVESYRKHVQTQANAATALTLIVDAGLEEIAARWSGASKPEEVINAFADVDALALNTTLTESQLLSAIQQQIAALDTALGGNRQQPAPAGRAAATQARVQFEIVTLSSAAWLFVLLATTGAGAYVLIFSSAGAAFGTARDFLVCFLWGVGLPTGAQLLQATTGTVATSFGVNK